MSETVFERLEQKLKAAGVPFKVTRHAPVYTSEEAAAIRGVALCTGAKALIVKAGEEFRMLVVPADRKLDSKKARASLGVKSMRFATREEVEALTTLAPGSIPPFGSLFSLPTTCDEALGQNETINFNAGDHSISIALAYGDYAKVEQPNLGEVT
jgi:Ala-tRNA(Pro) deacylase